jgi:dolichyl-phosphate-mannose-protein mannosyltransferase
MPTCQSAATDAASVRESNSRPRACTPACRRSTLVVVPLLLLAFVLQCAWFIRTQSFTVDESDHIIAGLDAWHYGEFERWHEHPPLARLWFALPLLSAHCKYENHTTSHSNDGPVHLGSALDQKLQNAPDSLDRSGWYVDQEVVPISPAPEVWLYRARAMNVVFGVALLLLLWSVARRLFSEGAANFILALAAISPELISHYSVATTDGAGVLFTFAAVAQLIRWRHNPSRGQLILLGLALGAALLSKLSTLPAFALVLLIMLLSKPQQGPQTAAASGGQSWGFGWNPAHWNWAPAAAAATIAAVSVWAGYFFHVSKVVFHDGLVTLHFSGYTKLLSYPLPFSKNFHIFIPACEFLTGIGMVVVHNMEGHHSYFLGQASATGGWKLYFPVAVLLKWPISILLLALSGALIVLRRRLPKDLLILTVFPVVFFAMAINGNMNIGVRHVLPVYPFVLLYAAAVWEWARNMKKAKLVLLALLCLQAADVLRYAPDYLSYFNVFIKPSESYRYLSDSNLDWGQGLIALRNYQNGHPNDTIHLAYYGLVDPAWYGIRYVPMRENEHPTGTVIVSATHLAGQLLNDPHAYHWLLRYPVKTILNHTLYVFEVPQ